MRITVSKRLIVGLTLAIAGPAVAKSNLIASTVRPAYAVPAAATYAGRPIDPDMGDDHAALRAIEVVCSKDTPAAEHSAICGGAISRG